MTAKRIRAASIGLVAAAGLLAAPSTVPAQGADESDVALRLLADDKAVDIVTSYPQLLQRSAIPIRPSSKGDPMVIPFIKEEYIRKQALEKMAEAVDKNRQQEALALARYLVRTYPGSPEATQAQNIIEIYENNKPSDVIKPDDSLTGPDLPPWVQTNTRSILYDPEDPIVMVGTEYYREGQPLREYPNIVIEKINADDVVYKVTNEFASKLISVSIPAD
jgi:hypothetical protein